MGDLIASLQIDVVSSRSAVVRFDAATGALVSKALLDGSYEPPSGCANDGQGSDYPPGGNSGRWLDKVGLASNEWYNDGGLEDDTINSTCFTQGRVWWIGLNAAATATLVGLNLDGTVHASYLTSEGDLSFAGGCCADASGVVYWVDFSHPNTLRRFDTVGGTQLADVALTNPIGGTPNWVNLSVTSNGAHLLATWYDGSGNSYLVVWDSAGAVVWHSTLVGPSYQIYSACFSSDNAAVYLVHSTPAEPSFGRGFDHRPIASTGFGTDPDTFDWAFDPATNWAGTPLLVWLGSQADETGYCVSTVHDFAPSLIGFPGGTATPILASPTADFFYQTDRRDGLVGGIVRTDAATWTITDPWVTLTDTGRGLGFQALAEDPSGNLYTFCGTGDPSTVPAIVTKVTPGGVEISGWASWLVPDYTQNTGLAMGRDGFLYVLVSFSTNTPAVYKIDLSTATVTLVSSTIFADGAQPGVDNDGGSCFGATSAGVLWFTLDRPPVSSPDYFHSTVVRSYDPSSSTIVDHAMQALVDSSFDGLTEAWGGGFIDADDNFIVPMVTFQANNYIAQDTNCLTTDDSQFQSGLGHWVCPDGTAALAPVSSPAHGLSRAMQITQLTSGNSNFRLSPLVGLYPAMPGEVYVLSGWVMADPANSGSVQADLGMTFLDSGGVAFGGADTALLALPPGGGLFYIVVVRQAPAGVAWVTAEGNLTPSAIGDKFYLSDVQLGLGNYSPDLSWVLRVDSTGVASRIAGSWSYANTFKVSTATGTQVGVQTDIPTAPLPSATATNIADGPLDVSLCCEMDGGSGISLDGKTLWFIDDGDQNNGTRSNLLRKLTLCPAARAGLRWGIHMGAT